ncbi:class I SAM-dependent methyltransferase [Micavibrio aeruginosavorus]|uniref:class I SAM-dependent methyltransferase n=1 Tax=Micavibrio aeruginosavorus TaxID=349221 RepID=UPI003F4A96BA
MNTGSIYDLKAFYDSRSGRLVRRILLDHLIPMWPDVKGLRVVGCGYATPYLRPYMKDAERVIAVMPARLGARVWPRHEKNLVCLAEDAELPLETESVDRILLVHSIEHAEILSPNLQELWRVLKSSGRIIVVVPNRLGFWARADWSPFGQGQPFSASQIVQLFRDHSFVHERTERALFLPPVRTFLMLRTFWFMERIGARIMPGLCGLHIAEFSKQLYAGTAVTQTSKVKIRGRRILVPNALSGGRREQG